MKKQPWIVAVCVTALFCSVAPDVPAGYRNVDQEQVMVEGGTRSEQEGRQMSQSAFNPRGGVLSVELLRENRAKERLVNRSGNFAIQEADALETMTLRFRKPEVPEGKAVFVYVVHGGRVNGKLADSVVADKDGVFEVTFQAGPHSGNYPVVVRYGGAEEVLEFWVGGRPTDGKREVMRAMEVAK